MAEKDPIDDILGDLGDFKAETVEEQISADKTEILLIGRPEIYPQFQDLFGSSPDHHLYLVSNVEQAAELLLQHFFAIIILDDSFDIDIPSISNLLRQNHPIARILLLYSDADFRRTTDLFNDGSFDGVILMPSSTDEIYKTIMHQEAQYAIQREVMKFVQEPPKLSKASFLLLDPSLSYGDENQPLNFVGVMVVVNSVPKYTVFFEKALENDEILFAAFLSSITTLGDELFHSKQALKEINFGGISVIFRFVGNIQLAFLVKNLTRHNYENAESRIDDIMGEIFPRYMETFASDGMLHSIADELDSIFHKFDSIDETKEEEYNQEMEAKARRDFGQQCIVLMSHPSDLLSELMTYLNQNARLVELDYKIVPVADIDEASNVIRENNVAIFMIDQSSINASSQSGLFMLESIEELDPAVQIMYLSADHTMNQEEINLLNSGNIDFVHIRDEKKFRIFASIQEGLRISLKIKQEKSSGQTGASSKEGLAVAKAMLKENLEAFDSEEKPALQGVVLAQNRIVEIVPLFTKFYIVDGELIDLDAELMAGLVTSLKQISGEMFTGDQSIDGLDIAGKTVFVRFNADFMFMYFVKNITANTQPLISKELDAVTMIYSEIIAESLGVLTAEDLEPIFSQIALKTHQSLTGLLAERS